MLAIVAYWICSLLTVLVVTAAQMKIGIFNQCEVDSEYSSRKIKLDVPIFNTSYFIASVMLVSLLSLCFWGMVFAFPLLMASIIVAIIIFLTLSMYGIVKLAPNTLQAKDIVETWNTIKEKYFTKDLTEDKE